VDVHDKLDEITATVEGARSMPMSASCVVNRAELLGLLDELRDLLPEEFDQADALLRDRDELLAAAQADAEQIVAEAHDERMRLISETEVHRIATTESAQLRADAESEAERLRAEADTYVDGRLAAFEVTLEKTLATVHRGRDRLEARNANRSDIEVDEEALSRFS
jgi:F0F1-type ATP synthase membrane subunit b/b'